MKFPVDVVERACGKQPIEAGEKADSYGSCCMALDALTAEDLVRALRGGEEPLAIAFRQGLLHAAEICEELGYTDNNAVLACTAAIRAEAAKPEGTR